MKKVIHTVLEDIEVTEKTDFVSPWKKDQICLTGIEYYPLDKCYTKEEITDTVISKVLNDIAEGTEVYLYLDEYAELEYMNVISDGTWISLAYCNEENWYASYNFDFEGVEENTPLDVGGQSPVSKYYAIQDMELAKKAVEYFVYTGKCYPGIDWATPFEGKNTDNV